METHSHYYLLQLLYSTHTLYSHTHLILKHLEGTKTHVRTLFVDFSSAFNTIQPHLLVQKLLHRFQLDPCLSGWILDFLINRSQRVRVNGHHSGLLSTSTGSPQGCVLSPLLYILYTDDCHSGMDSRHIIKFADDTVIVSLLEDKESAHGPIIDYFVNWCQEAMLELNVSKTKDMCIDFRLKAPNPTPTTINGSNIEIVHQYKYLGSIIDDKLTFNSNTDMLCKKGQQRLYCLRKLARFHVDKTLMTLFYRSFIESILTFSAICWYAFLNVKSKNAISKIIKVCSNITGVQQKSMTALYEEQVIRKAECILENYSHPLHKEFQFLPSGSRFKCPLARTNRYKNSFLPSAIQLLNSTRKHR